MVLVVNGKEYMRALSKITFYLLQDGFKSKGYHEDEYLAAITMRSVYTSDLYTRTELSMSS